MPGEAPSFQLSFYEHWASVNSASSCPVISASIHCSADVKDLFVCCAPLCNCKRQREGHPRGFVVLRQGFNLTHRLNICLIFTVQPVPLISTEHSFSLNEPGLLETFIWNIENCIQEDTDFKLSIVLNLKNYTRCTGRKGASSFVPLLRATALCYLASSSLKIGKALLLFFLLKGCSKILWFCFSTSKALASSNGKTNLELLPFLALFRFCFVS